MIINHVSLSWYVSKLTEGIPFSLTKHSDASLYCMQGREGGDCNGCIYTPELRQGLLDSVFYNSEGFYHGIQRLTDRDNEAFDILLESSSAKDRVWIDTGIIASQFVDGGLYPLIEALRGLEKKIVIVSNMFVCSGVEVNILPRCRSIVTPKSNTYEVADEIINRRCSAVAGNVYLFSCGMAACAMIPRLHALHPDCSFIDVGHLWDALLGNKIRHYQKDLTQKHIDANLRPLRK